MTDITPQTGTSQPELWRNIPGYEGYYAVSNLGRIKGLKASNGRWLEGRLLTPQPRRYMHMVIRLCKDGQHKMYCVHRLVMLAFVGEPPISQPEVNHINGIPQDNRLSNLEYCSRIENEWHKRHVLMNNNTGEKHGNSKLTDVDVIAIRAHRNAGLSYRIIAEIYSVSISTIFQVCAKIGWKHV